MIDREKLLQVKKIIVHKYRHDGTSSAMIIRDVLPDVEVFFAGHKDPEYLELKAEPGLLFCDISPPPKRGAEFMKHRAIVLDHHERTRKVVRRFVQAGLGVYGENDYCESGGMLAYKFVWLPLQDRAFSNKKDVDRLATLAGIRDTFKKDSPRWEDACIQTEILAFFPVEHFVHQIDGETLKLRDLGFSDQELELGKIQRDRFNKTVKRVVEEAYILDWNNIKVAIIPGHRVISDASEELRKLGVPVTLAFTFRHNDNILTLTASARSDATVFDCNKFCAKYGGGGHITAAGGLTVEITKDTLNPYSLLKDILDAHGKSCMIS